MQFKLLGRLPRARCRPPGASRSFATAPLHEQTPFSGTVLEQFAHFCWHQTLRRSPNAVQAAGTTAKGTRPPPPASRSFPTESLLEQTPSLPTLPLSVGIRDRGACPAHFKQPGHWQTAMCPPQSTGTSPLLVPMGGSTFCWHRVRWSWPGSAQAAGTAAESTLWASAGSRKLCQCHSTCAMQHFIWSSCRFWQEHVHTAEGALSCAAGHKWLCIASSSFFIAASDIKSPVHVGLTPHSCLCLLLCVRGSTSCWNQRIWLLLCAVHAAKSDNCARHLVTHSQHHRG